MSHMVQVESLGMPPAELGEGPLWLTDRQRLAWVDVPNGEIHSVDPFQGRSSHSTMKMDEPVSCLAPAAGGDLLVGTGSGVTLVGKERQSRVASLGDDRIRMNDGKCDPDGRFIVGTTGHAFEPGLASLFRLDNGGVLTALLEGLTISNGLAWPTRDTMYFIDTPTSRIDIFDYEISSGEIHNRRTLREIPSDWGLPDGMTLDLDGNIWVAFWGGSCVRAIDSVGSLLEEVRLPVPHVTSCTFGGPELRHLFITTARQSDDTSELAGDVFVLETSTQGLPPAPWRGLALAEEVEARDRSRSA